MSEKRVVEEMTAQLGHGPIGLASESLDIATCEGRRTHHGDLLATPARGVSIASRHMRALERLASALSPDPDPVTLFCLLPRPDCAGNPP